MAQLIVRNLDPELVRRLKQRAAARGRSAEAEHRQILREALQSPIPSKPLSEFLRGMPDVGSDDDFTRERDLGRPDTF